MYCGSVDTCFHLIIKFLEFDIVIVYVHCFVSKRFFFYKQNNVIDGVVRYWLLEHV